MADRTPVIRLNIEINQQSMNKSIGGVGKVERAIATLGYRAARTSALLDRHVVDPLKRVAQASIEATTSLDKSMGEIQTLMKGTVEASTERIEAFKESIESLSITVAQEAVDLSKGLYEYISAFQEIPETMRGFEIAAKVAKAGVTSTKQAVDLLSSVSLAYGDVSIKMQQNVADLSFEIVRLAKTHIPELAANVSKVAPVAAIVGIEFKEIAAHAATLIGITGDTTEVFTQLRRVMLSMQKPNQTMTTLLKSLGYAGATAGKQLMAKEGLFGAITSLNSQAANMGISIEKAIGRIQGIMPVLAYQSVLVRERFEAMYKSMENPGGATEAALSKLMNGIASDAIKLDKAKLALKGMSRELGDKLLPYLIKLYDMLVDLLDNLLSRTDFPSLDWVIDRVQALFDWVKKLADGSVNFLTKVAAYSAILSPLLGIFGVLAFTAETAMGGMRLLFLGIGKGFKNLSKGMKASRSGLLRYVVDLVRGDNVMREFKINSDIAFDSGDRGFKKMSEGIRLTGGIKSFIPMFLGWAAAIVAVVIAIKLISKAWQKWKDATREVVVENQKMLDGITAGLSNFRNEVEDILSKDTPSEIKSGFMDQLVIQESELTGIINQYDKMVLQIREKTQEIADAQRIFESSLATGLPGAGFFEGLKLDTQKGVLAELQGQISDIQDLWKQKIADIYQLKFEFIPNVDTTIAEEQIDAFLAKYIHNAASFEIEVVLDSASLLNKVNDIFAVTTNSFTEASEKIQMSLDVLSQNFDESASGVKELRAQIALYTRLGASEQVLDSFRKQLEYILLNQKAILDSVKYLKDYQTVVDALANESGSFADGFITASQTLNNYNNALDDNLRLAQLISENSYPQSVIDRFKQMVAANDSLIAGYEDQVRELKIIASIPALLQGNDAFEKIFLDFQNTNRETKQLESSMLRVNSILKNLNAALLVSNSMSTYLGTLQDIKDYEAILLKIKTDLDLIKDKTNVQSGLEGPVESLKDYNEALLELDNTSANYSIQQIAYLQDIVDSYDDTVAAALRVDKIMKKIPKNFKGIKALEDIWLSVNQELQNTLDSTNALRIASIELTEAELSGNFARIESAYLIKSALEEQLALMEKLKDEANKTDLFSGTMFNISQDDTTFDINFEWEDAAKGFGNVLKEAGASVLDGFSSWFPKQESGESLGVKINEVITKFGKGMSDVMDIGGDGIWSNLLGTLTAPLKSIGDMIGGDFSIESFAADAMAISKNMFTAIPDLISVIPGFIGDIGAGLSSAFGGIFDAVSGIAGGLIDMGMSIFLPILLETPEIQAVMNSLIEIFTSLAAVLGPAVGSILSPLVKVFGQIGTILGLLLLPVLEALAPIFKILAILVSTIIVPILSLLAPVIAIITGVIELLTPIIIFLAKLFVLLSAPMQYAGGLFTWMADMIKTGVHNLLEWLNFAKWDKDYWEAPKLDEAMNKVTEKIKKQLADLDEALSEGAGAQGEDLTDDPEYYSNIGNDPLNPYAGDPTTDSSGSGANIQTMHQTNNIEINVGALVGEFDDFVRLIEERMIALKEIA